MESTDADRIAIRAWMGKRSQSEAAALLKISGGFFSEWLSGKKEWSWGQMAIAARVTGLPVGIFTEARTLREAAAVSRDAAA